MVYKAPRFGTNILSKFYNGMVDVPSNTIKAYNQVADSYNSGDHLDALEDLWDLRFEDGAKRIPDMYRIALSLVREMDPKTEIITKNRSIASSALLLLWIWGEVQSRKMMPNPNQPISKEQMANFGKPIRGTEDLYETVMVMAERLPYEKRIEMDGVEFYSSNLLAMLWSDDSSIEGVDYLDLRTIRVLKSMDLPQRQQTMSMMSQVRMQAEQMKYDDTTVKMREMMRYVFRQVGAFEEPTKEIMEEGEDVDE